MKPQIHRYTFIFIWVFLLLGCTTQKNTFITRTYHNTTSKYNVMFNGRESFKQGLAKAYEQYTDDYTRILPVYPGTEEDFALSLTGEMDRALTKGSKVITFHSIKVKPEAKRGLVSERRQAFFERNEFNKWMDENYLIMGKAHFYKHDFYLAAETFRFIEKEFEHEKESVAEAQLWLARTYVEMKQYRDAEELLEKIMALGFLSEKLHDDFYATYAQLYLNQEDYDKASENLNKAIEETKKRRKKQRYTFILAQIAAKQKNMDKAYQLYADVIKLNPEYEMAFNAKINQALAYQGQNTDISEILDDLFKMLKDDKNIEYQDQIYYAIANLYYKRGDINTAIDYYKQSAWKMVDNAIQQGRSYLAIADIYYNRKQFELAQAYYDSAVVNLPEDYPNYRIISAKATSLNNLVNSLEAYYLQDSLQQLAMMPEVERLNVIDNVIANIIMEEEEAKLRQQQMLEEAMFASLNNTNTGGFNQQASAGGWYFYNLGTKSAGQNEFRLKWGNRKLEDNWRRKNKTIISTGDLFASEESVDDTTADGKKLDNKSREYHIRQIPLSDSAMEASNTIIKNALYNAATIYKNELLDYEQAEKLYTELQDRYSDDYALLALYSLYDLNRRRENTLLQEYYKNEIINKYPESLHAKVLLDPNYIEELEDEEKTVDRQYELAYDYLQRGNYDLVKINYQEVKEAHAGHILLPKFEYLNILASRNEGSDTLFRSNLTAYIQKYPNEEITEQAKRTLELMDAAKPELLEAAEAEIAEEIYAESAEQEHFVVFSVPAVRQQNQLTFNILNFNIDNYEKLKLNTEKIQIDDSRLVVIKKFNNASEAKNYLNHLQTSEILFRDVNPQDTKIFIISVPNYATLNKDKSVSRYLQYYRKHY